MKTFPQLCAACAGGFLLAIIVVASSQNDLRSENFKLQSRIDVLSERLEYVKGVCRLHGMLPQPFPLSDDYETDPDYIPPPPDEITNTIHDAIPGFVEIQKQHTCIDCHDEMLSSSNPWKVSEPPPPT